jgi:hypothetical protein
MNKTIPGMQRFLLFESIHALELIRKFTVCSSYKQWCKKTVVQAKRFVGMGSSWSFVEEYRPAPEVCRLP